jgi:hypothetical protein
MAIRITPYFVVGNLLALLYAEIIFLARAQMQAGNGKKTEKLLCSYGRKDAASALNGWRRKRREGGNADADADGRAGSPQHGDL